MPIASNGSLPGGGVWFPLDEANPVAGIRDASNTYEARCTGSCPVSALGARGTGKGLRFVTQQLRISGLPDPGASSGYTIAVWASLDILPRDTNPLPTQYSCALSKPNKTLIPNPPFNDGNSYALCVEPSNRTYVYTTSDTRADGLIAADGHGRISNVAEWHHLAATWDAVCRTQVLYFDGCRVNARTGIDIRFDPGEVFVGADNLGTSTASPSYYWNGTLDDIVIYNRALDDAEIQQLVGHR